MAYPLAMRLIGKEIYLLIYWPRFCERIVQIFSRKLIYLRWGYKGIQVNLSSSILQKSSFDLSYIF